MDGSKTTSQADELAHFREQIAQRESRLESDAAACIKAGVDADVVASAARKQQDELAVLRRRRDDIESVHDDFGRAGQRTGPGSETGQAGDRLATMTDQERAEVIRLPDIRVVPLYDGRPPSLRICGFVSDVVLTHRCDSADRHPSSIEA